MNSNTLLTTLMKLHDYAERNRFCSTALRIMLVKDIMHFVICHKAYYLNIQDHNKYCSTNTQNLTQTNAIQVPGYFSSSTTCAQSEIDMAYSTSVTSQSDTVLCTGRILQTATVLVYVCTVSCNQTVLKLSLGRLNS